MAIPPATADAGERGRRAGRNGTFTITVINANSFDLVGSSLTGAYVNNGWASMSRNADAASSTEVRLQLVTLSDYAELTIATTAGRGSLAAG